MRVLRDYWNQDNFFEQDFVRNTGMTCHRSQNLLAALPGGKLEEDAENEHKKRARQHYDTLFKIKP